MPIIISNFAKDIIEYKNNLEIEGGPALFIEKYFKDNNIDYEIITGNEKGEVLIFNNNGNDIGLIKYAPEIILQKEKKSDYFIISTLVNEFDLGKLSMLKGTIFCDIQGYIRELNSTNRKLLYDLKGIESIDFLKVADYEFQYLTRELINKYIESGGNILITTGGKGIIKIINKFGENIINIPTGEFTDTIGAGDTFLVSFADNLQKTNNINDAVLKASNYVYNFLKQKNN